MNPVHTLITFLLQIYLNIFVLVRLNHPVVFSPFSFILFEFPNSPMCRPWSAPFIFCILHASSPGATQPIVGVYFAALYRALASSRTSLLDHIQRRATVGRTPLNE